MALLQWNSCLAVSYPARVYGIKRGDSFDEVHSKSGGRCMAVHVPLLETNSGGSSSNNNSNMFDGNYESVYQLSHEEQHRLRDQDIGRRRFGTEGKACLERYRVASRRIFEVVMGCLGMVASSAGSKNNTNNSSSSGVILEKASIDEFFLDVTAVCSDPNHPLWKSIHSSSSSDHDNNKISDIRHDHGDHNTMVVGQEPQQQKQGEGQNKNSHDNQTSNKSSIELERGCQLAHYIRQSVCDTLGFTLSAGISTNKMVAKLAASYNKPNGQAVVGVDQILGVMQDTKLSKVRNFGGKLGKALVAMLPPDAPPTMGSIARYLSLPQLQDRFPGGAAAADASTTTTTATGSPAMFIFRACRGHDKEPVEAKNTGNVVKSITAFKSLPRALDADVEDPSFVQWLALLVQEVVARVETDAQRNHRYPRNCTVQYGLYGQVNPAGRLDMKSFRIPFPAQRFSKEEQITHLMEKITTKMILRASVGSGGGNATTDSGQAVVAAFKRKRIRPVRIGVCATDMNEEVNEHGSIANFFSVKPASINLSPPTTKSIKEESGPSSSSSPPNPPKEESKHYDNHHNQKQQVKTEPSSQSVAVTALHAKVEENEDEDSQYARELQAAFDKEEHTLSAMDGISSSPKGHARKGDSSKQQTSSQPEKCSESTEDDDMAAARKLQASYDNEHSILGSWETRKQQCQTSDRGQPTLKKAKKTRKISAFFKAG